MAMILTARIPHSHLAFFTELRRSHFPAARNYLDAHLTIFHNISDRHLPEMRAILAPMAAAHSPVDATVAGIRHLGKGVAFAMECPGLEGIRDTLRGRFEPWLCPQDLQGWRPHITIQNGVTKAKADELYALLAGSFESRTIAVTGLDLWHYRGGPWQAEAGFEFK